MSVCGWVVSAGWWLLYLQPSNILLLLCSLWTVFLCISSTQTFHTYIQLPHTTAHQITQTMSPIPVPCMKKVGLWFPLAKLMVIISGTTARRLLPKLYRIFTKGVTDHWSHWKTRMTRQKSCQHHQTLHWVTLKSDVVFVFLFSSEDSVLQKWLQTWQNFDLLENM